MTDTLAPMLADKVLRAADRVVACLDGLSDEEAAWQPPAPDANSVASIVGHVLSNLEENTFSVIAGQPSTRDRATEFDPASVVALRARWADVRPGLAAVLAHLTDDDLQRYCQHPRRGAITVAEMLVVMRGHIGEHEGQAALTRDMVVAERLRGRPSRRRWDGGNR
jgi:hypothetical protein